jgi:hypothetical protein
MAIKLGSSDISKVYLGATEVSKIYLGVTEIYSAASFLLDIYTGAGFAYDFRALRAAYSGNNIRARESSGSTEQNIGFASGVLDSSSLLTFTGSNDGLVPIEYDQSTNGNNLTQTTASNQLEIVDAGALVTSNSLAATQGSSSTGGQTSSIAFSGMTDIWLFAVVEIINTSTTQVLYESSTNYNQNAGAFGMFIQSGRLEIANRYSGGAAMIKRFNISTGRQVISIRMRSGADVNTFCELYINGVIVSTHSTSGSGASVFSDQVLYLNARAGTSIGFTGKRQASIFYPSDQSSNRVGIETNMMDYYGLLFLDLYPNAAAAYSLRKLRYAYTGNCIRVRRSSDSTELDIGFVNNVLDTASLLSFTGSGDGFVTKWYDQSGNAKDIAQATAANQPQIVASGSVILEGTNPSVKFLGTSYFDYGSSTFINDANILAVTANKSDSVAGIFAVQGDSTGAQGMVLWNFQSKYSVFNSTTSNKYQDVDLSLNKFACIQFGRNTSSAAYFLINGTLTSNTPSTTEKVARSYYLGTIGTSNFRYTGHISEFIVHNQNMYADINGMQTNVNNYYEIY